MASQDPLRLSLREAIASRCHDVAADVFDDFFERMDPEYFSSFQPDTIARHIRLASALSLDNPCESSCVLLKGYRFELTVVAYVFF
jgi:glutamate-ammonia-ligase adenylyltransferase